MAAGVLVAWVLALRAGAAPVGLLTSVLLVAGGAGAMLAPWRPSSPPATPPPPAASLTLADEKSNFTSMVSHELKAPVASIRLYAEMLRDNVVVSETKRKKFYATIADEAIRLQALIDNLLDLGRIQSGNKSYRLGPVPLEGLIEEAIRLANAAMPARVDDIRRGRMVPGARVLADRTVAVQAITNLITNGLKYGAGRPIELEVERQGPNTHVRVADRGAGISPADRERIFEPYVRAGSEDTREASGTGLGLALVRAYMLGHDGGAVDFADRPGGGTVFTLTFKSVKGEA